MLPNKMKLSEKAFISLRRLQTNTGLTVNIGARLAFFASLETQHKYKNEVIDLKHRELDKHTWLGDQASIVEMLLTDRYPKLDKKSLYQAWASHIDHGAGILEVKPNLQALTSMV